VEGQPEEEKQSFFILDGHSLAYRAFYALPLELQTKSGMHTNAVLGFVNMLLRLREERRPGHLAVAFDYPGPTFRHQQYEQYKATREKTPDELKEQVPVIKEIIQGFNIPIYELEGYEADDIIGTYAREVEQKGMEVVIVTADADFYQLLTPSIKSLITRKGISQLEEYGPDKLQEKYSLHPEQWVDFKALKGDSSDNVPGVPGIGEKRALQLLKDYGSLEEISRRLDEIPGKMGENLRQNIDQAFLSRELVQIRTDVPVSFQFEGSPDQGADWNKIYQLFTQLEFKSIIEKIPELAAIHEKKPGKEYFREAKDNEPFVQSNLLEDGSSRGYAEEEGQSSGQLLLPYQDEEEEKMQSVPVETAEQLVDCVNVLRTYPVLSCFTWINRKDGQDELQDLALSAGETKCYYINFRHGGFSVADFFQAMKVVWEDPGKIFLTHELKPFIKQLLTLGEPASCRWFDTALAAYLIDPDKSSYALPLLTEEYLGKALPEPEKKADEHTRQEQKKHFLTLGSQHLLSLKEVLEDNLNLRQLEQLYYDLELPLVRVLARMELNGIKVQEGILNKISQEIEHNMTRLEEEIFDLAGERFNLNSPKQLSYILFEKLNLPTIKKIKTGYSTDAQVLEELAKSYPIAARLLQYRTLSKIKNTYLEGLRPLIHPKTGKIHTTFNQAVTATGRLSSKDPNLQNIPIRLEEGRRLRQAFTPSKEGKVLLAADYSQIELRIMAHLSRDPNLIDAFNRDQDIHTRTAAEVFGVSLEEVTSLMRSRAKAVNFGIIYGMSDYGLSQDLGISRAEAREYIENYFARYPGVKNFVEDCIGQARERGFVTTVMNRRRYLADINHRNHSRRSFAERMARNTPIQGSAADIIKAAMVAIDRELEAQEDLVAMLLQVHDELIFELAAEALDSTAPWIREIMENTYSLSVPLKVDLKVGNDWYHMYPLELS